jgi:membrane-bound ClpP family serine protease
MCHILWMMPILGLPLFWFLDFSVALPLYLGILALSGVVMGLTVQSLKQPPSSGLEGMRGDVAEVIEAIRSRGRVRYHNTLWYAAAPEPIDVGETVRIVGNTGLCLRVEKLSHEPDAAAEATQHCGPRLKPAQRR